MTGNDAQHTLIREHLEREKGHYLEFLQTVKLIYTAYSRADYGKGRIYRIYSRGDKQDGDEFKTVWQILHKMGQGIKLTEVYDIIAITIVCPFMSDMDEVINYTQKCTNNGYFSVIDMTDHRRGRSAYEAVHYYIAAPHSQDTVCEVQIKTVLHDAWAAKTHDLTYKPFSAYDTRFGQQMDTLAAMLAALERQSELIRQLVEEGRNFDKERRRVARQVIIRKLSDELRGLLDDEHRTALEDLQKKVQYNLNRLAPLNDSQLQSIQNEIKKVGDSFKYDRNLCRIGAVVVVDREDSDCLPWLQRCVARWKQSSSGEKDLAAAYHFEGLILYCFGQLERAISQAEEAVKLCRSNLDVKISDERYSLASAMSGLAYYFAELEGTSAAERLDAEHQARSLIADARKLEEGRPEFLDTEGYVEIAFGKTEAEIEAGLGKCERSWRELRETSSANVSDLFFKIHKRTAYRRLLQF